MSDNDQGKPWRFPVPGVLSLRTWTLWSLPPSLVISVITVEVTILSLVGLGAMSAGLPSDAEIRAGVLVGVLGIAHTEAVRNVERVRRRVMVEDLHINLGSVWYFAGAVLLSPTLAAACTAVVHVHLWWRADGARTPLYRQIFSTSSLAMASFAASAAMTYAAGSVGSAARLGQDIVPVLVLGMLVFATVNTALVAGAIAVSSPGSKIEELVGDWDENLLELTTLCLGALTAAAIVINPWLAGFAILPLLMLHRAVLVRHLREAATIDGKTGLLNAAAWHTQAQRALRRVVRSTQPRAVLVLDLDHFKTVNDTHGHLAGDHVLAAVAGALRDEVRDRDLVGRFGGEEFVVLLSGLENGGDEEFEAVAERIRGRIASLRVEIPTPDGPLTVSGLSISVGGVVCPQDGGDLQDLLQIADTALYAAKHAGRNMVRMGPARHASLPRVAGEPSVTHQRGPAQ